MRNCDDGDKMRIYGEERGRLVDQKAGQDLLMGGLVAGVSGMMLTALVVLDRPVACLVPFGLSIVFMVISGFISAFELNNQIDMWDRWIVSNESRVESSFERSLVPYLNRISVAFMLMGIVFIISMPLFK